MARTQEQRTKDLGLGVSGIGLGALLLRANHDAESRIKVRGVFDPDPDRQHQRYDVDKSLAELASEFGVDRVHDTYEQMLDDPDIHCIGVFSPCPLHHEQVMGALNAGKHVLVTKPMASSPGQAAEIVERVEQTGLVLLVAQSMRWNDYFLRIRELFDSGELGEVRVAEGWYVHDIRRVFDKSPWRYEMPQDLIYGGVCPPADLLRWFLGEAEEVSAYANRMGVETRYPEELPLNYFINLKYRNGAIARVMGAYDIVEPPSLWEPAHPSLVSLALYGTKASVMNDRLVRDYYGLGKREEELLEPTGDSRSHSGEMTAILRHFEECITEGRRPLVNARDGAQVLAICEACWESIRSGQPAKVTRRLETTGA